MRPTLFLLLLAFAVFADDKKDALEFPPMPPVVPHSPADELKTRFENEIKTNKVVIFMKGNQLFPQCGFSARAVDLLKPFGPIHTVDVLSEPGVRDGIKAYSSWPTIPQIYINGKFVGGSDILTELAERGELEALVKADPRT